MLVLKRELDIEDFFYYDLNTVTGQIEFDKILFYMRQQLYSEIPLALDKELNRLDYECNNYVIEYKKVPWGASKLYDEIHRYPYADNGKYVFKGRYYAPGRFEELVLSRKPFDLYLYIKTMDEYKKEEITKKRDKSE